MRFAGNFHPEWGYLAPAPSFMRTARIVAVATAIGATAGAGVVLSLAGSSSPGPQADAARSLVIVHSLVQPAEAAPSAALPAPSAAPAVAAAPISVPAAPPAQLQANIKPSALSQSAHLVPPPAAQVSAPVASESSAATTAAAPASVAALAESPPAGESAPAPAANQMLVAPDQTAVDKNGKKNHASDTPRGPQAAAVPAKKKPEGHGLGPMLRHLFSARTGTSYYPN
jgi:hypothetical protein